MHLPVAYRRSAATAACLLLAYAAWLAVGPGPDPARRLVSNIGFVVASAFAAVSLTVGARRLRGRARVAWSLVAASSWAWVFGNGAWFYYQHVAASHPYPSLADIGYIAAPLLAVSGLLTAGSEGWGLAGRVRTLLDGLVMGTSLLFVSAVLILEPLLDSGAVSGLAGAVLVSYPVLDVMVAAVALSLALRVHYGGRLPVLLVASGLCGVAAGDSGWAYLGLQGAFTVGTPLDALWIGGYTAIGFAGLAICPRRAAPPREEAASLWRVALPYLPALVALLVSSGVRIDFVEHPVALVAGLALVVLLAVRQLVTLLENVGLNRQLEAKVAERTAELEAREARFRSLVQHSSDVIAVADDDGTLHYHSPSVQGVLGMQPGSLEGRRLFDLLHPDDREEVRATLERAASVDGAHDRVSCRLLHRHGYWVHVEAGIANRLHDNSVRGFVLNLRDVSERRLLESELARRATQDALTGLANRTLLRERLEAALERSRKGPWQVALLVLDLDGFKAVNDSLGHLAGDELLRGVADRLRATARASDTVARLGGDEFAVLLQGATDQGDAVVVAQRLLVALGAPLFIRGRRLTVRASVGLTVCEDGHVDAVEMLREADIAMYAAKRSGKGRLRIFEVGMTPVFGGLELATDLQEALANDELQLHYQPIFAADGRRICGVEALLRWQHRKHGWVPPSTFIPVAEDNGIVTDLDRWVLRRATAQGAAWGRRHPRLPLTIAVNLSGRDLESPTLQADVAAALTDAGLAPERLQLEVTEGMLMGGEEAAVRQLGRLRDLGVSLAIDDFGTGYSSLARLLDLPVRRLKIDRSFVERLDDGSGDPIVSAIVAMAHSLGLDVVAEGVETQAQLTSLRRFGCDQVQGFLLARPAPARDVDALLARSDAAALR